MLKVRWHGLSQCWYDWQEFSEWRQCQVLEIVCHYRPESEQEVHLHHNSSITLSHIFQPNKQQLHFEPGSYLVFKHTLGCASVLCSFNSEFMRQSLGYFQWWLYCWKKGRGVSLCHGKFLEDEFWIEVCSVWGFRVKGDRSCCSCAWVAACGYNWMFSVCPSCISVCLLFKKSWASVHFWFSCAPADAVSHSMGSCLSLGDFCDGYILCRSMTSWTFWKTDWHRETVPLPWPSSKPFFSWHSTCQPHINVSWRESGSRWD